MIISRRRLLGQHYLHNRGVLEKIVRAVAPGPDDLIVEIGPGRGALTFPLAERAGRVVALEKDERLVPELRRRAPSNLEVIEADVLRISFREILSRYPEHTGRVKLAGNLPYSISSPLLFKLIEERTLFSTCVFLLQREFARRLCALAGSKLFAPLSILVQNHFEAAVLFTVSPASFSPPPKVDSALVRLEKRPRPLYAAGDESSFRRYLQAAFQQRRKTLWNNLAAAGFSRDALGDAFHRLDIDHRLRSEALPSERHRELFEALSPGENPPR